MAYDLGKVEIAFEPGDLVALETSGGAYDAMTNADVAVIVTEWNEFRGLDVKRMKTTLKSPIVVDLRNVYEPDVMREAGITYTCIGRGVESPKKNREAAE